MVREVPIFNLVQSYFGANTMWPQHLQLSKDECRGILRRLELETYSLVVSVFRAQGGLSDSKARLLDELRALFHISQERHRAEARRVANDEQLATIADLISGPNTWQEWSREGRRPYPLLPRVAPQTALSIIANNISEKVSTDNQRLPYPSETGETAKLDQLQKEQTYLESSETEKHPPNYVITTEPFKVPDIPVICRKNSKRASYDKTNYSNRKRTFGENILPKNQPLNKEGEATSIKYSNIIANTSNLMVNSDATKGKKVFTACRILKTEQNQRNAINRTQQLAQQQKQKQQNFNQQQGVGNIVETPLASPSQGHKTLIQRNKTTKRAAEKNISSEHGLSPVKRTILNPKFNKRHQQKECELGLFLNKKEDIYKHHEVDIGYKQQNIQQLKNDQETLPIPNQNNEGKRLITTEIDSNSVDNTIDETLPQSSTSVEAARKLMTITDEKNLLQSQSNIKENIVENVCKELIIQHQNCEPEVDVVEKNSNNEEILTPPIGAILPTSKFEKCHPITLTLTMAKTTTTTTITGSIAATPIKKYIVENEELLNTTERKATIENVSTVGANTISPIINPVVPTTTQILQIPNVSVSASKVGQQIMANSNKLRTINSNSLVSPGGTKITMSASVVKKLTNIGASNNKILLEEVTGESSTYISNINNNKETSAATAAAAVALHELANIATSNQNDIINVKELQDKQKPLIASRNLLFGNQSVVRNQLTAVASTTITTMPLRTATSIYTTGISATNNILASKLMPVVISGSANLQNTSNMLINGAEMVANVISNTANSLGTGGVCKLSLTSNNCMTNKSSDIIKTMLTTTANINSSTNNVIISTVGMVRGLTTSNSQKTTAIYSASVITTATATPIPQTSVANIVGGNKSNKPQIISNIKLPPFTMTPNTCSPAITFSGLNTSSKAVVTTGMKLCHSGNGKVYLQQTTNQLDNSKIKLSSNYLGQHKTTATLSNVNSGVSSNVILSGIGAVSGGGSAAIASASLPGSITSGNQRYSLQKVQIIHATPTFPAQNTTGTVSNTYGIGGNLLCKSPTGSNINLSPVNATVLSKNNMIIMPSSSSSLRTIYGKNNTNNMVLKAITPLTGSSGVSGINDRCSRIKANTSRNVNQIQYSTNVQNNAINTFTVTNISKVSGTVPSGVTTTSIAGGRTIGLQRQNIVVLDNNNRNIPYRNDCIDNLKNIKLDTTNSVTTNVEGNTSSNPTVSTTPFSILDDNDVPLDIMNMPIIVDSGNGEGPESMTLLDDSTFINSGCVGGRSTTYIIDQSPRVHPLVHTSNTIVMNATDWEMELDNAITAIPSNHSQIINTNINNIDNKCNKSAIFTIQRSGKVLKNNKPSTSLISSFSKTTSTVTSVVATVAARPIIKSLPSAAIKNVSSNIIPVITNSSRKMNSNQIIVEGVNCKLPISNETTKDQSLLTSSTFLASTNTKKLPANAGVSNASDNDGGFGVANLVGDGDNFENVIVEDYNEECHTDEILSSSSLLQQSKQQTYDQQSDSHVIQSKEISSQIRTNKFNENAIHSFILESSNDKFPTENIAGNSAAAEASKTLGSVLTAKGSEIKKSEGENIVGAIDENTAIEFIDENGQTTPLSEIVPQMVTSLQLFNKIETTSQVSASTTTPTNTLVLTSTTSSTTTTTTTTNTNKFTTSNQSDLKVWMKGAPSNLSSTLTTSTSSSLTSNVISLNSNFINKKNLLSNETNLEMSSPTLASITEEKVIAVSRESAMSNLENFPLQDLLTSDCKATANVVTTDTTSTVSTVCLLQDSEILTQVNETDNNTLIEKEF